VKKIKFPSPDGKTTVDATEVEITESTERWCEYRLEDGAVIRAKPTIVQYVRIDGQYDADGNPVYAMRGTVQHDIMHVPDELKKKVD